MLYIRRIKIANCLCYLWWSLDDNWVIFLLRISHGSLLMSISSVGRDNYDVRLASKTSAGHYLQHILNCSVYSRLWWRSAEIGCPVPSYTILVSPWADKTHAQNEIVKNNNVLLVGKFMKIYAN